MCMHICVCSCSCVCMSVEARDTYMSGFFLNHFPLYFLRQCLTLGFGAHQLGSTDGPASSRNPPFSISPALGLQTFARFLCGCWGPKPTSPHLRSKLSYLPAHWLPLSELTVTTPLGSGLQPYPIHCHYWSFPSVPLYTPPHTYHKETHNHLSWH